MKLQSQRTQGCLSSVTSLLIVPLIRKRQTQAAESYPSWAHQSCSSCSVTHYIYDGACCHVIGITRVTHHAVDSTLGIRFPWRTPSTSAPEQTGGVQNLKAALPGGCSTAAGHRGAASARGCRRASVRRDDMMMTCRALC